MCGRFTYRYTWAQLHALLNLSNPGASLTGLFDPAQGVFGPRFNVAPTQRAPVVRARPDGSLVIDALIWGLQPPWLAKPGPINARAETASTQPMFRSAFKGRRCVVPVSGFYEWQAGGVGKAKQPWYIHRADGQPLLLAGLWEARDGLETFTVITTGPNEFMARLHNRMPATLEPEQARPWLSSPDQSLLAPAADGVLTAHTVSTRVNSPRNDEPSLVEPVAQSTRGDDAQSALW